MLPVYQRPERWETIASEYSNVDEDKGPQRDWGSLPVAVLTRDQFQATPGQSDASHERVVEVWKHGHQALAARSNQGEVISVPGSSHYIQASQPAAVVAAIRKVLAEVGTRQN